MAFLQCEFFHESLGVLFAYNTCHSVYTHMAFLQCELFYEPLGIH